MAKYKIEMEIEDQDEPEKMTEENLLRFTEEDITNALSDYGMSVNEIVVKIQN